MGSAVSTSPVLSHPLSHDEFSIFAEMVVARLRAMPEDEVLKAMSEISNLLVNTSE